MSCHRRCQCYLDIKDVVVHVVGGFGLAGVPHEQAVGGQGTKPLAHIMYVYYSQVRIRIRGFFFIWIQINNIL